jgi:hypothetical protein
MHIKFNKYTNRQAGKDIEIISIEVSHLDDERIEQQLIEIEDCSVQENALNEEQTPVEEAVL